MTCAINWTTICLFPLQLPALPARSMKNPMNRHAVARLLVAVCLIGLAGAGVAAQGFKFSQEDEAAKAKEQSRMEGIADRLSTPCRAQLKDKKIMLIIGEQQAGRGISANQQNYGPHFMAINRRLQSLGLRTTTPEEIRKQIAQAEIDAYFRGDPDAALAASRKFGASFILRGLITTESRMNAIIRVNEVVVDMDFSLTSAAGKIISSAAAQGGSFAGSDVRGMAAKLIEEQADEVVARLYSDYCRMPAAPAAKKKK